MRLHNTMLLLLLLLQLLLQYLVHLLLQYLVLLHFLVHLLLHICVALQHPLKQRPQCFLGRLGSQHPSQRQAVHLHPSRLQQATAQQQQGPGPVYVDIRARVIKDGQPTSVWRCQQHGHAHKPVFEAHSKLHVHAELGADLDHDIMQRLERRPLEVPLWHRRRERQGKALCLGQPP